MLIFPYTLLLLTVFICAYKSISYKAEYDSYDYDYRISRFVFCAYALNAVVFYLFGIIELYLLFSTLYVPMIVNFILLHSYRHVFMKNDCGFSDFFYRLKAFVWLLLTLITPVWMLLVFFLMASMSS